MKIIKEIFSIMPIIERITVIFLFLLGMILIYGAVYKIIELK